MGMFDQNGGMYYNMPVTPAYGGYGYPAYGGNGGFGDMGFGGSWLVLFILLMFGGMGGWGMGGFGGMGGMMMWPWLMTQNTDNIVQNGFNQQAIANGISAIQGTQADQEVANCNRAMDQMRTSYENQIASLERSFNAQTAIDGRLDGISRDLDQCCCKNQLATESLRATILQENCQDRYEAQNNTRDIIQNQNQGFQMLRDDIHKVVDDQKDARIRALETQVNMQNLAASQAQQTAQLVADNTEQTRQLIQRIAPYPVPSWPVNPPYGYNQGASWGGCYNNGGNNGVVFGY